MFTLKNHIEKLEDKRINENIYIENGVVFVNNGEYEYKYQNECWYIKAGENWINMQGGIPNYSLEENIDERIFESRDTEIEEIEEQGD